MEILTIIVVSYNTKDLTLACLKSVYEQTKNVSFQLIVVDNDSSDGSAAAVAREFPQVQLISLNRNIGFAGANNLAAQQANGRYILLLNPDTVVLDEAVERLVEFAQINPNAGIWGGRTLFGDGKLNPTSCWKSPTLWSLFCRALHLSAAFPRSVFFNPEAYGKWQRDTVKNVDIVTGCFFLIDRDLWNQLQGFDTAFFMYGEEADLCLRAKRKGFHPMITPAATIIHYGGASEKVRSDKLIKVLTAKVLLIKKHWHPLLSPLGTFLIAIWVIVKIVLLYGISAFKDSVEFNDALQTWLLVWRQRDSWLKGVFV